MLVSLIDPQTMVTTCDWEGLAGLFTDLAWLESRIEAVGIGGLLNDLHLIRRIPVTQPRRRLLDLLREAIVLDSDFLREHPESLFQCLWNRCWWYDSPTAQLHYELSSPGYRSDAWEQPGPKLWELLEQWHSEKKVRTPEFTWLRSLRAPHKHLGSCIDAVFGRAMRFVPSPDGKLLAVNFSEKGPVRGPHRIRLYDLISGQPFRELAGHDEMISGFSFSPDSKRLASCADEVKIWDIVTGELIQTFRGHLAQYWANGALQWKEWAERLAAGEPKEILPKDGIGESESGQINLEIKGPYVSGAIFVEGGRRIVSYAHEARHTIRIWDVDSARELQCIECPDMWDLCYFILTPDESRVLTGEFRTGCLVIDLQSGKELHREPKPGWALHGLRPAAVSPDGSLYAFAKEHENQVKVVRAHDFCVVHSLRAHQDHVTEIVFSPDGKLLATGSYDSSICIWNVRDGVLQARFLGHRPPAYQRPHEKRGQIDSISWSLDNRLLATSGDDGRILVWDVEKGTQLKSLSGVDMSAGKAQFLPDGHRLVGRDHENVLLWDIAGIYDARELKSTIPCDEQIGAPLVSPDRKLLAFHLPDFTIRLIDALSGLEKLSLAGAESAITSVRWFPDAKRIAAASKDGAIRIWDVATGEALHCLRGHGSLKSTIGEKDQPESIQEITNHESAPLVGVNCLAIASDGHCLASGGDDGTVRIWDPENGNEIHCLKGHEADIHLLFFLNCGKLVSFSGCDNTSRIWDLETGRQLRICPGDYEYHGELHESPDGRLIVYLDEKYISPQESECTPVVIDTSTGKTCAVFEGHGKTGFAGITFFPDNEVVATSGYDDVIRIWKLATGKELRALQGVGQKPGPLRYDVESGQLIALPSMFTRSAERVASVWNPETGECLLRTTDPSEIAMLEHPEEAWYFTSTREIAEIRNVKNGRILASLPLLVCQYYEVDRNEGIMCLTRFRGSYISLLKLEGSVTGQGTSQANC